MPHVCLALWHEGIFPRPAVKGGGRPRTEAPTRPWGLWPPSKKALIMNSVHRAAGVGFHITKWWKPALGLQAGFLGSFMGLYLNSRWLNASGA